VTILHMGGGRIAITCEVGQCIIRATVTAASDEDARAFVAHHNHGWYTRRQRGEIIDACQYHLGSCCIAHARPGAPGVDPAAYFPPSLLEPTGGHAAPAPQPEQLDLFAEAAA
jgi:hypothetical protein